MPAPAAGKVVDIEREAELGGSIHSKGVMILSNLLGARYAVIPDMRQRRWGRKTVSSAPERQHHSRFKRWKQAPFSGMKQDLFPYQGNPEI